MSRVYFANGYGASIICTPYSYGGAAGLSEIAVLHDEQLCYRTPITSDVLGYLTDDEVAETLAKIEALRRKRRCSHGRVNSVFESHPIRAFFTGMLEFRRSYTTLFWKDELAYDRGRDLAHRLTFRKWDES